MPSRTLLIGLFLIASLAAATPALAGTVYQWKDAKGVTHYSDSPPPDRKGVQNRELKDEDPASPAASTKATAKPSDEATNCAILRSNVAQLQSSQPVGLDADGDGKPDKAMSDAERAQQLQQAELSLKVYCDKPAKP